MDVKELQQGSTRSTNPAMKRAEPSKTAEAMALYRYSEMFFPPDLRICEDPYAVKFLGPEITKMFSLPPEQLNGWLIRYRLQH